MRECIWIGRRFDRDERRQRYLLAGCRRHVISVERLRRQPPVARYLRDDLIRSSLEIESVYVVAAEQRRERTADALHGDAEVARLGTVDLDPHHRLVEVEIAVGDDEQPALARR